MSNIHGEIIKIMKYDDKYHIKKSIQNKGRTAYGEDGHTQVINRIFRIVQSDPKNEGFLEEVDRAKEEFVKWIYDEPGAMSDEEMCLYYNSYLEAYMEEVSMEELKNIELNDEELEELYEIDLQLSKVKEMSEKDKEEYRLQLQEKMNSLDLDLNDDNIDAEDKEFLEAAALFYNNKEAYEK